MGHEALNAWHPFHTGEKSLPIISSPEMIHRDTMGGMYHSHTSIQIIRALWDFYEARLSTKRAWHPVLSFTTRNIELRTLGIAMP